MDISARSYSLGEIPALIDGLRAENERLTADRARLLETLRGELAKALLEVFRANHGHTCYRLEVTGTGCSHTLAYQVDGLVAKAWPVAIDRAERAAREVPRG